MKLFFPLFLFQLQICMKATQSTECSKESLRVIPDCNCKHATVQHAVSNFISPILSSVVSSKFFRYFFVELDRPCPFWKENGLCMMEGCSVCTCPQEEIPKTWIQAEREEDFGWISNSSSKFGFEGMGHDQSLGRIEFSNKFSASAKVGYQTVNSEQKHSNYFQNLFKTEDCENFNEWTELAAPLADVGVYVNLLENPERFTGYAGPPAHRVWKAIKEENCFGSGIEEMCLEKRIFYRLMSGLQASISTHIARQYLHSSGEWGVNLPLYWNAVGNHQDRVDNLYLAFLFLLRATMKARQVLLHYPYDTGNYTDDKRVKELMTRFFSNQQFSVVSKEYSPVLYGYSQNSALSGDSFFQVSDAVEECSYGFNEQRLFQVSDDVHGPMYWQQLEEKHQLREEFRLKFRNISRILDCVTCEKCRLWGKLQILGFGTAIKILLSNEDDLVIRKNIDINPNYRQGAYLNRQEVIALINTLNQFAKSVEFTAFAERERHRIETEAGDNLPVPPRLQEAHSEPDLVLDSPIPQSVEERGKAWSGLALAIGFLLVSVALNLIYAFLLK